MKKKRRLIRIKKSVLVDPKEAEHFKPFGIIRIRKGKRIGEVVDVVMK